MRFIIVKDYVDRFEVIASSKEEMDEYLRTLAWVKNPKMRFLTGLDNNSKDTDFVAVGKGADIALGAMEMGATVIKAAEIVSKYYPYHEKDFIYKVIEK